MILVLSKEEPENTKATLFTEVTEFALANTQDNTKNLLRYWSD